MSKQLIKNKKGFTIIEVMIVLAIAGLIMLIVFLAIPNLQRNSRNTGRRADAGRVGTAATNFVANNNGTLPTTVANATTIVNDAGNLSQFGALTGSGLGTTNCAAGTAVANDLVLCKGAAVTLTQLAANSDGMVLAVQATCGAGAGIVATGTARQMALFYTIETSGQPTWSCIQL
jgi:prepilin-type N-terminal cleavage/methylation domain-containing protein